MASRLTKQESAWCRSTWARRIPPGTRITAKLHQPRTTCCPYLDHSISALLDDLQTTGRLQDTLVIVTGEFGRTPKSTRRRPRPLGPGDDLLLLAGGGVHGGTVIGAPTASAHPGAERQTPENLAATIYAHARHPAAHDLARHGWTTL